jgi:NADP-dependent 3-hydroxy acid dehydrogenase YdfG
VLTARREPLLTSLAAELEQRGSQALVAPADALDPAACETVLAAGIEAFGRIDVAVLNAGGGQATSMATASSAEVLRIMRLNNDTAVHSFNGSEVPTR